MNADNRRTVAPTGEAGGQAELVARRQRALGPAYRSFYQNPLHLVRGEGVWLFDPQGNAYLDAYNNVASVGHCHPHVVEALSRQAAVLNTHTRYLHPLIVDYAERLLALCPVGSGHAMFTCTGSEANDLAIRIARHATGGRSIIATRTAYHGATVATAAISPSAGGPSAVGAENRVIDAPDTYLDSGSGAEHFAANLQAAIDDLARNGLKPAALIFDTAFSSDGIFYPRARVLREACATIRKAGGLLIADEVQAGFGRLGSRMWGFERAQLEPDIVTMGKPMGDGHPIAGLIARPELLEGFGTESGYFNTFGGNPVSAAVGLAVLEIIEQENILQHVADTGSYLREGLLALKSRFDLVGDVRGEGLYFGVEIVESGDPDRPASSLTARVVEGLRDRRLLVGQAGPRDNVLKIRPPLVFSRANCDQLVDTLDEVLKRV